MNPDDEAAALAHQQELEHLEWAARERRILDVSRIVDALVAEGKRIAAYRNRLTGGQDEAA